MRVYWAVLTLVLLAPGCAELQDHRYRMVNHGRARQAWKSQRIVCDSYGSTSRDYQKGWEAGYYEVLTGGQEVPPTVPPKEYWGPKYQTPEGRVAIDDWYNGFQAGAMLAGCSPIQSEIPLRHAVADPLNGPHYVPVQENSVPNYHDAVPEYHYEDESEYSYPTFPIPPAPAAVETDRSRDGRSNAPVRRSHGLLGEVPSQREFVPPAHSRRDFSDHKTSAPVDSEGWAPRRVITKSEMSVNQQGQWAMPVARTSRPAPPVTVRTMALEIPGHQHISDGILDLPITDHLLVWKDWRTQP